MIFAADYPFLDVMWSMIVFFAWVVWIWMMIVILGDVFRRDDIGGWGKAAWCVFMIILPFIGVLTYLIAQHDGMNRRNQEAVSRAQKQFDDRVREVAHSSGNGGGGDGAATQIEAAARLRASGTINDAEFETLKAKALAG